MNVLDSARDLGRAIQQNEIYLKLQEITKQADADKSLQDGIGEFNLKRFAINREASKEEGERDEEALRKMNEELRVLYAGLMENPNMVAYNAAKNEFDTLMQKVNTIISMCSEGADPDSVDVEAAAACGGNCSSCAGCH